MGVSESVVGRFLKRRRADVKIATKAGIVTGAARRFDNSAAYLRAELDASLKRLGVDHVTLFYIHRREAERPVEEVVETLAALIREGKIGGYGLSEVSPGTLRRAHAVHPCMAVQNEYSLWTRQPEMGLIQTCAELGTAFVPFSPLARGVFGAPPGRSARPCAEGDFRLPIPRFHEPDWSLNTARIAPFRAFCAARGWTVPAAALAWVLDQGSAPDPHSRHAHRRKPDGLGRRRRDRPHPRRPRRDRPPSAGGLRPWRPLRAGPGDDRRTLLLRSRPEEMP